MKRSCPSLAAVLCIALFSLTFSEQASGSSGISIDPSFGFNLGLNGSIRTALPLANGKVLIGGTFSTVKGAGRNGIARLNSDGSNDASFNPGLGADDQVTAMAVQSDGKILIGGNFSRIDVQARGGLARLNADGSLDASFESSLPGEDWEPVEPRISDIVPQDNGKVLVNGRTLRWRNEQWIDGVVRLNEDGSLDGSFDPLADFSDASVQRMIASPDGGVLLLGEFFGEEDVRSIVRLHPEGSIDPAFTLPWEGTVSDVAFLNDGSTLIAGALSEPGNTDYSTLVRLTADGAVDSGFQLPLEGTVRRIAAAADGTIFVGGHFAVSEDVFATVLSLNADGSVRAVTGVSFDLEQGPVFVVESDGKLLVQERDAFLGKSRLRRLQADGGPDETFSITIDPLRDVEIFSIARQPDGRILLAGRFEGDDVDGPFTWSLIRLALDGSLDETFQSEAGGGDFAAKLQPDGKIIVASYFWDNAGNEAMRVMRLNEDGRRDAGLLVESPGEIWGIAVQSDGKILLAGSLDLDGSATRPVWRLNADGSLDGSFDCALDGIGHSALLQPDGKILVVGELSLDGNDPDLTRMLVRLRSDGSLDETFSTNLDGDVYRVWIQPDGKLLVEGSFRVEPYGHGSESLVRLHSNGSRDRTFKAYLEGWLFDLGFQSDARILVLGGLGPEGGLRLQRLNADGSLDGSYNVLFTLHEDAEPWLLAAAAGLFQENDDILIGGSFTCVNGVKRPHLVRFRNPISYPGIAAAPALQQQFVIGSPATLSVAAAWNVPSTYQWFHNGMEIPGANSASYSIASVKGSDAGSYAVRVSNATGTITISNIVAKLALHRTGSVDLSFDPGSGLDRVATLIVPQEEGKILITGGFTSVRGAVRRGIARLNADGTNDDSFDPGWGVFGGVRAIVPLANGQILIGGGFVIANDAEVFRFDLARLNADGSLDLEFNADVDGDLRAIVLQDDGNILIGGSFFAAGESEFISIARLNWDGSVDTSFDPAPEVIDGAWPGLIESMGLQPDGKIVIGGSFTEVGGAARSKLARLNGDGSLDNDFEPNIPGGWLDNLLVQENGMLVATSSETGSRLLRLNPDGAFDSGFDLEFIDGWIETVVSQADGKILIAGYFSDGTGVHLKRLKADGSFDEAFTPESIHDVYSIAMLPDGSILVGADSVIEGETARAWLAKLNANGRLDESLDAGAGIGGWVSGMALRTDGKLVIAGYFASVQGKPTTDAARLNEDGMLDETFRSGADFSEFDALALQDDNKVLLGGKSLNGSEFTGLVRLNEDGSLDETFLSWDTGYDPIRDILVQPDGRILVGGGFGVVRLHSNGELDESFEALPEDVAALAIHPSGRILGAGWSGFWVQEESVSGVEWFNISTTDDGISLQDISAMAVEPDGNVLVAVMFGDMYERYAILRVNLAGERDRSFLPIVRGFQWASGISVQDDGKILVCGRFSSIDSVFRNGIARLNPDGSLDTIFNPGSGADGDVEAMVLQPDGRILIAGGFVSIDGVQRSRVARLHGDSEFFMPGVEMQPQPQISSVGGSVTFSVTAAGTGPFAYQWFFNDEPIDGATEREFTRVGLTFAHAGLYRVAVSNAAGTVLSETASLSVNAAPEPLAVLNLLRLVEGQFLLELSGPTNRTYIIESTTGFGDWTAVVTNGTGSSGAFSITVSEPLLTPQGFYRALQEP